MIPVSSDISDKINERSRTFKVRFLTSLSPVEELTCDVAELTVCTGGGGEYPVPGAVFSSYMEAKVLNLSAPIKGADLYLQLGVIMDYDSNTVGWLPSNGLFRVTKTSVSGNATTFTATGRLSTHCQSGYSTSLNFPAEVGDVLDDIADSCDIDIDASDFDLTGLIWTRPEGTDMEVLSMIAGVLGGFVTEDYRGYVVIKPYGSGVRYNVGLSRFGTMPTFTEQPFEVTGLECTVAEGISYSSGTPNITIENRIMTGDLFDAMASEYVGYSFYPAMAPLTLGDPRLEPSDILCIEDGAVTKEVPCHQITTHMTGALWQEISSELLGVSDDDTKQVKGAVSERIAYAQDTADSAKEIANNTLIYDHTYEYTNRDEHGNPIEATFTAYLYRGGEDIKYEVDAEGNPKYPPTAFTWYLKTEDMEQSLGFGYMMVVDMTECGYGAEVIGKFTTADDNVLLTRAGAELRSVDDAPQTVRVSSESEGSVRINDLAVATTLYDTDKLLVVGLEDEHLISLDGVEAYLNTHLDKQIFFDTTSGWSFQTSLVSKPNTFYVYTDYQTDSQGNNIAGIKVGDGNAYVVDLPFTDTVMMEHMHNSTIHITGAEREFWNNKVRCYYAGDEQVVFTTL